VWLAKLVPKVVVATAVVGGHYMEFAEAVHAHEEEQSIMA
jgi:hypothetical protein